MRQEAEDLTDVIRNGAMLGSGGRLRGLPSSQGIVSVVILVFCGGISHLPPRVPRCLVAQRGRARRVSADRLRPEQLPGLDR